MKEIGEYRSQNCCITTSGLCFIKWTNYFTKKDYSEDFLPFV